MIFDAIKKLFNKDENTEQIEYLGTDKDGNKIYEGYYHEFKGIPWVFNKTTYTREEFDKAFYECLEEHNVNPDTLPPLVEPEILVSYEAWIESKSQLHPNELITNLMLTMPTMFLMMMKVLLYLSYGLVASK